MYDNQIMAKLNSPDSDTEVVVHIFQKVLDWY